MKIKRLVSAGLLCALLLSAVSCDVPLDSTGDIGLVQTIIKQDAGRINDAQLRDNQLLYANQDPTEVVTMYLTVSTGNSAENTDHTWEEINTYSVYDYDRMGVDRYKVAGLLQVGDETGLTAGSLGYGQVSPNCTVQVRGQTSSNQVQKNYKISIKENKGSWNGQTTIALNKHVSDGLRFRNKMTYDLIAGIDELLGLRTTFVHLYVKDTTAGKDVFEDYGLYTQVEQLNKTALRAHGLNKDGHLYKINAFEFYRYEDVIRLKEDAQYDEKAFEKLLEIKGDDDHRKLIEMLRTLNNIEIPVDVVLDRHFDMENLTYWMAFHILMGNKDTESRNVYIYSPLNSNKWYFYTWDNDAALMKDEFEIEGRIEGQSWQQGISNYWGNMLFHRALKSADFRQALDEAIEDLYRYLTPERINGMAETYASVVKPYVFSMPDVMYTGITEEEYDRIAAGLAEEIGENYRSYKDSYLNPMPFFIYPPEPGQGEFAYRWENSYDFSAETITYSFALSDSYDFKNILLKKENLLIPEVFGPELPAGQYFIRVEATNESSRSQYAFDYYVVDGSKIYGTKCFYVMEDGSIVEDVYVEG